MPYGSNLDLPPSVREHLPEHAQAIFREAFNAAWDTYGERLEAREALAFRVAWSAVKKGYRKLGRNWVPK
ncbi:MAG: cation transporter [Proteobacteria bacterium]|nr:cation transporter [Pseudomonadota bacterium]